MGRTCLEDLKDPLEQHRTASMSIAQSSIILQSHGRLQLVNLPRCESATELNMFKHKTEYDKIA